MKCGEKEWKEAYEVIDRIQGRRESSPYRFTEVKAIVEQAEFLVHNTEVTERNNILWLHARDEWDSLEDTIHDGEDDFRRLADNNIRLKIDRLKSIIHTMWEFGFNDKPITDHVRKDFAIYGSLKQKWGDEPEAFTLANFPFSYGHQTKKEIDELEHKRYAFFSYYLKRHNPPLARCFGHYIHELNHRRLRPADLAESFAKHLPDALAKKTIKEKYALEVYARYTQYAYLFGHSGEGTYESDELEDQLRIDLDALKIMEDSEYEIFFWANDTEEEKQRWTKLVQERVKEWKQ